MGGNIMDFLMIVPSGLHYKQIGSQQVMQAEVSAAYELPPSKASV